MDKVNELLENIFEIRNIKAVRFKKIALRQNKTVYFIFNENITIFRDNVISASIEPAGFILQTPKDFYYFGDDFSEDLIEKFTGEFF